MDNKTLILLYGRMISAIELMQFNSEEQIKYLGKHISVDDIGLTFDSDVTIQTNNFQEAGLINDEQYSLIININNRLDKMSDNKELWSKDKLNNIQWEECRLIAKELLLSLKENDIESFINDSL